MRTLQSYETRKQKRKERNQRGRARKQQLHFERTKDEPIRGEWRGRFAFTITFQNRITGEFHALDFYISDKRVNSFRIHRDSRLFRAACDVRLAKSGVPITEGMLGLKARELAERKRNKNLKPRGNVGKLRT